MRARPVLITGPVELMNLLFVFSIADNDPPVLGDLLIGELFMMLILEVWCMSGSLIFLLILFGEERLSHSLVCIVPKPSKLGTDVFFVRGIR